MAWIRLSDDYTDHPKFSNLSDGAFRLWHQGMAFCRKFKTDGLIPSATVKGFKAFSRKRAEELTAPWNAGENPLWLDVEGFGVKVHDYLDWNLSKEEEAKDADAAAKRMRRLRLDRRSPDCSPEHQGERSPNVPGGDGKEELRKKETSPIRIVPMSGTLDPDLAERAGRFCDRYAELYPLHRRGARYLPKPALDYTKACELCAVWDNARLERLAVVFLKCEEPFAQSGSRTIGQFAAMASWADDRLREAEAGKAS